MSCVSNEPQELLDFGGTLQLEGKPSRLELLLAMEKQLVASWEANLGENARANLSLVRRLILTERIKEWMQRQQAKIATGVRVVVQGAKGWVDGLVEGVEEFACPRVTLLPAVRTRGGVVRTRGAVGTTPTGALLQAQPWPGFEGNVFLRGGDIEIALHEGGRPLKDTRIWLVSSSGDLVAEAATDASGKVSFSGLPDGAYAFLIEHSAGTN